MNGRHGNSFLEINFLSYFFQALQNVIVTILGFVVIFFFGYFYYYRTFMRFFFSVFLCSGESHCKYRLLLSAQLKYIRVVVDFI